jgi:hypothetical protein
MKLLKGVLVTIFMGTIISIPLQVMNGRHLIFPGFNESGFSSDLYNELHLNQLGLQENIFRAALQGHRKLQHQNKLCTPNIVTIADMSQSSIRKRLYVIDLERREILFHTYVSHGKNSGELYATRFSNTPRSLQSSLGFYVTGPVYNGKHGISLQLIGQEPGFNHLAADRAIVVHGADYVSEQFIRQTGRLGRSFGCPAVASELAEPIINTIQDGSCLFVYSPDPAYLKNSPLLVENRN